MVGEYSLLSLYVFLKTIIKITCLYLVLYELNLNVVGDCYIKIF